MKALVARLRRWPTRRWPTRRDESGRAVVEFVFLGVLVLVPIVYLIITLAAIQRASFAVSTAAREAGRVFVTAPTQDAALELGTTAAQLTFEDYGLPGGQVTFACDGAPCLRPEGRVEVTASIRVTLPLVPDALAGVLPASVPVTATHVATVDRFRQPGGGG